VPRRFEEKTLINQYDKVDRFEPERKRRTNDAPAREKFAGGARKDCQLTTWEGGGVKEREFC